MNTLTRYIIGGAVTLIIAFLVWFFSDIVAYILIAAVLAIIGKPEVKFLMSLKTKKFKMPKWAAALITLITIWLCLLTFVGVFFPMIFAKLNDISGLEMDSLIGSFRAPIDSLQAFLKDSFGINASVEVLQNSLSTQLADILNIDSVNAVFSSFFSFITSTAIALFSISFVTFFFLKEDGLFQTMVIALFPTKYEMNITRALDSVTELLVRYFTGILAESCIMMFIVSIITMLFGLSAQDAFFMGIIVGVLNVIPYIGPLIGAAIGVLFGFMNPIADMPIYMTSVIIACTIFFAQGIDNFLLQPMLYSNRVKAHPLEIFIVILIAGSMAGVLGMLLAIPSYTVIRVFAKEFFYNFSLVRKLTDKI
ncbi:MAG: AI-2E family transporter [Rikenellaceae bacterium]